MLYDQMCKQVSKLKAIFYAYDGGTLTIDEAREKAAKVLEEINQVIEREIQKHLSPASPTKKPAPAHLIN